MSTGKLYEVALSFAGEDRPYVRQVADFLRTNGVRVFYDEFEQAKLWGTDLQTTLDRIYRTDSDFVVMFISVAYASKVWTKHERRSALAAALTAKQEYVLPARFDETELEGLSPTIAYLDLRRISPGQLGDILLRKLIQSGSHTGTWIPSTSVPGIIAWRITRERFASDFSGRGTMLIDTRWHRKGTPLIYTSGSICGALLELLAHIDRSAITEGYVAVPLRIPSAVPISTIYSETLPPDWEKQTGDQLQYVGAKWTESKATCVLSVPSVFLPEERTYIFNPSHPDFTRVEIGKPRPITIDRRLLV